ncbi:MAG: segregation/condensation protein A [Candidatus Hydrogenedentes bacterium]|jgi:segregation and condensation protein A|nr:segregation/condensation protein A [Candidatus Hydrogenedentota bacterium]
MTEEQSIVEPTVIQGDSEVETLSVDGQESSFSMEALRLELDQFEGPFELLLYLIKEQEIDIFDIPIVQVTEQYLQFLDLLRIEHLNIAGDFLVMAATLIQIKSRMILPIEADLEDNEDDLEEEDPRLELVGKLLEYRKFRDLAKLLGNYEEKQSDIFTRRVKIAFEALDDEEEIIDVSLYDLMKSVRGMIRFLMGQALHEIQLEGASVDEKITLIEDLLEKQESVTWTELCRLGNTRIEHLCSLLAILELCRMHRLRIHQYDSFGEIRLFLRSPENELSQQEDSHALSPLPS